MPFKVKLIFVVLIGFLFGLLGHQFYKSSDFYRANRVAELFEKHCVNAHFHGEAHDPLTDGLFAFTPLGDGASEWIDEKSRAYLKFNPRNLSCSISAVEPNEFSRAALDLLTPKVENIVAKHFPELEEDQVVGTAAPFAKAWLTGKRRTSERWGVSLIGFAASGNEFTLIVSSRRPRSAEGRNKLH